MRTVALTALLLGLSLPLALPASAADGEPSDKIKAAKALFQEGFKFMNQRDYENARIRFLASSSYVSTNVHTLWNLAFCEINTEHFVEATQHFRAFLHHPDADAAHVAQAKDDFLPKALRHVGQIDVKLPSGTAKIDGVDTYDLGSLADPIPVTPGHHHVEATAGERRIASDVDVAAGQTVALSPPEAAPPPAPAPAPIAVHLVPVSLRGAGDPSTAPEPPPAPSRFTTGRKVAVGLGVAGVAVAGVGIGFGVAANSAGSDAASLRAAGTSSACSATPGARCTNLHDDITTAKTDAPIATALYIGGGALAAGALILALVSAPHQTQAAWSFVPTLDRDGAGLRLSGAF